jgi:hypothetical protein
VRASHSHLNNKQLLQLLRIQTTTEAAWRSDDGAVNLTELVHRHAFDRLHPLATVGTSSIRSGLASDPAETVADRKMCSSGTQAYSMKQYRTKSQKMALEAVDSCVDGDVCHVTVKTSSALVLYADAKVKKSLGPVLSFVAAKWLVVCNMRS